MQREVSGVQIPAKFMDHGIPDVLNFVLSPFFSNPTPSSDNLVGMHKNRLRNGEAERLGGLEIDNKFVLSRMTTST